MRSVEVRLGERSYRIVVGAGLIDSPQQFLPQPEYPNVVVIADRTVSSLYGPRLASALGSVGQVHLLEIPSSEKAKSWDVAGGLLQEMARLQIRRNDLLVGFGGGVATDLGGFLASVYQRGIDCVHISTTLLGQVDAAIGGKTGVNLPAGKNLVGTFYQPKVVLADVAVLPTLEERQLRSGLAEVIKYGLCYDGWILQALDEGIDEILACAPERLEEIVGVCAGIKAGVVSGDESDRSARIMLNYGHTLGHALEASGGYERWLHGEAISVGMVFAAHLACEMGMLSPDEVALHTSAFEKAGLPVRASFDPAEVAGAWAIDKKFSDRQRWVLLDGMQNPTTRTDVTSAHIEAALGRVLAT